MHTSSFEMLSVKPFFLTSCKSPAYSHAHTALLLNFWHLKEL